MHDFAYGRHISVTLVVLACGFVLFELTPFDLWVQDWLYQPLTQQWLLSADEPISHFLFYTGIKKLLIIGALGALFTLIFLRNNARIKLYRKGLLIAVLSFILVPSIIGYLKGVTNIPCPKHLSHYGGKYPHVQMLDKRPNLPKIRCYPAGHASGGFALMALFFLFKRRRNRYLALAAGLSVGWSMGFYKMLIGDHFLGHTVTTMTLAWLIIVLVAYGVEKMQQRAYLSA